MFQHQAVLVVAGCSSEHLLPLNTTGLPPALLPVANQPLITYPLHTLESGGVHDVLVVRRATLERVIVSARRARRRSVLACQSLCVLCTTLLKMRMQDQARRLPAGVLWRGRNCARESMGQQALPRQVGAEGAV